MTSCSHAQEFKYISCFISLLLEIVCVGKLCHHESHFKVVGLFSAISYRKMVLALVNLE